MKLQNSKLVGLFFPKNSVLGNLCTVYVLTAYLIFNYYQNACIYSDPVQLLPRVLKEKTETTISCGCHREEINEEIFKGLNRNNSVTLTETRVIHGLS